MRAIWRGATEKFALEFEVEMFRRRKHGHQQTPFVVGFVLLFCTLGMGVMTVIRDGKRAARVGETLDFGEKVGSFVSGFGWGLVFFVGLFGALFLVFLCGFWLEKWKWKRRK